MAMAEGMCHGYGRGYVSWLWQRVCVMAMAEGMCHGYGRWYVSWLWQQRALWGMVIITIR